MKALYILFLLAISFTAKPCNVVVTITPPSRICAGNGVTITATGGGTYKWSTGATTSSITVIPATTTTYKVVVSDSCGKDSATTTVTVDNPKFTACCGTTITKGDSAYINISGGSGSNTYSWSPSVSLNCDTCRHVVATPAVTTTYTVQGTDSYGCSYDTVITITVTPASIQSLTESKDLKIYPNPNNGSFQLLISNYQLAINGTVEIYNLQGEKIYSKPLCSANYALSINLFSQPNGVYLYRVVTDNGQLISKGKLVIQK
ncbi:MAG TPA: T9SS type A sorting domain-containing protein [Bacteroidia bacterium]|jgi:hypothetical protein|nr:T9SS type A sorting domain-containing protein [Bacteroidia bacterium]